MGRPGTTTPTDGPRAGPTPDAEGPDDSWSETHLNDLLTAALEEAEPSASAPEPKPSPRPAAPKENRASAPAPAVGIDLGTTYSVVAFLDPQGRPASIVNASGDLLTPSVVLFDDDGVVVGKEAVAASAIEPQRVAECVKRDMGAAAYRKPIKGESMPPEVISSMILRQLKSDAERRLGPISKAVITVPAYFDEPRRRATADAGRLAGIDVLDIVNEPTAAALAYAYQLGLFDREGTWLEDRPFKALVYDLGGGTFDITVVELKRGSFRAIATDGDVCLGGKDWDAKLVALAAERFVRERGSDPRTDPVSLQDLALAAEAAKRTLSERARAGVVVNHGGQRLKVEVTREEFEEATAALLERTRATTEIVVMQAGLSWPQIDRVLLVGGSTRMPMVRRMLQNLTGKPPDGSLPADEAVAHGAALYAGLLLRKQHAATPGGGFAITNVNSHSLGLVAIDPATKRRTNQVLIPKNTALPHSVTRRFRTGKPGQKSVKLTVLEGESENPDFCTRIGVGVIRGLPADLPQGSPVEVTYTYQANNRLRIVGRLKDHQAAVTTVFERVNDLSESEFAFWVERLAERSNRPRDAGADDDRA
jgi:molecular chaperone DnaK